MPEIKHQFIAGKMNKDLDERLVPNGEYRDAMNIQLATSEGPEVGTIQNILGNSLVPGQEFISDQSYCVGMVADEKNDKLYYFINSDEELLVNGSFDDDASSWSLSQNNQGGWEFVNGKIEGTTVPQYNKINQSNLPINKFIVNQEYEVSFDVSNYSAGKINVACRNENGAGFSIPGFAPTNGTYTSIQTIVAGSTADPNFYSRFYIQRTGSAGFTGDIDNISIKRKYSAILEFDSKTNTVTPVIVDSNNSVLKFSSEMMITGLNVIDDILLWTDNVNEPRKINIPRCKQGTSTTGLEATKLVVKGELLGDLKEEDITVIKKSPSKPPGIETGSSQAAGTISGPLGPYGSNGSSTNLAVSLFRPSITSPNVPTTIQYTKEGDEIWIGIGYDIGNSPDLSVGDIIRLYVGSNSPSSGQEHVARLLITELQPANTELKFPQAQNNFDGTVVVVHDYQFGIKVSVSTLIDHVKDLSPAGNDNYYFELEDNFEGIFKRKFPRFAYRYKYEDGEYSSVGPFTEVIFIPGEFKYHPTKAYNEGMVNNLKRLTLKDFVNPDIPLDAVQIDLLYKNDSSPNVYLIKTLDKNDVHWLSNGEKGSYDITTENIYTQIPSNQLIRPWDNVPKTALAQEITGNRVVYANYTQGYDMLDDSGDKIIPDLSANLHPRYEAHEGNEAIRSLKSQRTYNVGLVYGDKYGRETPVFTNDTANQLITKSSSASANALSVTVNSGFPSWADYYKVFIKETSNEYYNLAMGRIYDAQDSNVWVSFPSVDRNKVNEDTYLILKKGVGYNDSEGSAVLTSDNDADPNPDARYKIVAIENEAPEYIKTEYTPIAEVQTSIVGARLFGGFGNGGSYAIGDPANGPSPGKKSFTIDSYYWQKDGSSKNDLGLLDLVTMFRDKGASVDPVYVSFSNRNHELATDPSAKFTTAPIEMSKKYEVVDIINLENSGTATSVWGGHNLYKIFLSEVILQSESWLTEYLGSGTDGAYNKGGRLRPHFYRKEVSNKPEFDGRFFVKIIEDQILSKALRIEDVQTDTGWEVTNSISNLYYLKDGTGADETGQAESKTKEHWDGIFTAMGSNDAFSSFVGKWFIDETHYAGVQPNWSGHPNASVVVLSAPGGQVYLSDITTELYFLNFDLGASVQATGYNGVPFGDPYYPNPVISSQLEARGTGQSLGNAALRGIHEGRYNTADMNDEEVDAFIDTTPGTSSSHTNGLFLSLSYSSVGPSNVNNYDGPLADPNISSIYPAGGKQFWENFEEVKNWVVGNDGGTNSFTSGQEEIVSKLSPGSLFRLVGDANVYKIKGVTKKRIYNYMGTMHWGGLKGFPSQPPEFNHPMTTTSDNPLAYFSWLDPGFFLSNYGTWSGSPSNPEAGLGYYNTDQYNSTFWNGYNGNNNPKKVYDLMDAQNIALAGDNIGSYTAVHAQHQNITAATNCRVNYLINYEVVSWEENPQIDSDNDERDLSANNVILGNNQPSIDNSCRLQFVKEFSTFGENRLSKFPAIFETEATEDLGLDIYYEASSKVPVKLSSINMPNFLQVGATIGGSSGIFVTEITYVAPNSYDNITAWRINISAPVPRNSFGISGSEVTFYNEDNSFVVGKLLSVIDPAGVSGYYNYIDGPPQGIEYVPGLDVVDPGDPTNSPSVTNVTTIIVTFESNKIGLSWFNCWSFGNGVESNRIGDTYNKPFITNGVKASTTLLDTYEEEHRKYGLIYSGIYNSTSGVNDLNQFIAGEKITKDVNPIYGSIQKLHSRSTADGDLITLCEDRILKILANKDALYNADGNPQLIANNSVLGQTIPFVGEYGISKNPESFASESYRTYFTDRVRGAVIRLSRDGLTPISNHGMKDWFKDNLSLGITNLLGENNLSSQDNWNIPSDGNSAVINGEAILGYYNDTPADSRFGRSAKFRINNILEIGKKYRLQFYVEEHGGYNKTEPTSGVNNAITINNEPAPGTWQGVSGMSSSKNNGSRVNITWTANKTTFELLQYQACKKVAGVRTYDSVSTQAFVASEGGNYTSSSLFYGGTVKIKDLIIEEVKEDAKLIGSYDDNKQEYNITIHGDQPATVSFKEEAKGWVSFKSFTPEHAISCANNYYTMNSGKLWQHHNPGVNRNTFYDVFSNSSFDVLLNDMPSSVKSYHALDYEGSQSRVDGIKTLNVTGVQHDVGAAFDGKYAFFEVLDMDALIGGESLSWHNKNHNIKQYRNNTLIFEGLIIAWANTSSASLISPSGGPTKGHFRKVSGNNPGDFKVGDIITTQLQEDTVGPFNSIPKDGWYVDSIDTDKEKGSLLEFIEKEGKWFNYIKGVKKEVNSSFDFGALEAQGLGIVTNSTNLFKNSILDHIDLSIDGGVNTSLQIGDTIYYEQPSQTVQDNILDANLFTSGYNQSYYNSIGDTGMGSDLGFVIQTPTKVSWYGLSDVNVPSGVNYFRNVTPTLEAGATYFIELVLTGYDGTGNLGFASGAGVGANMRLSDNGSVSRFFVSDGASPNLYARSSNKGTMEVTIKKVVPGGVLGFTRVESNTLTIAGVVTSINSDTISLDLSGVIPPNFTYAMFVKNQVINMSGLSGYYASAKFQNNSKIKAELFSVSSEISESSK